MRDSLIISQINNRLGSMTTKIDTNFASVFTSLTSGIVSVGNSLIAYINNTILGTGLGMVPRLSIRSIARWLLL